MPMSIGNIPPLKYLCTIGFMAEFDEYLWQEYKKFAEIPGSRRGKSQAEFARYLGISPTNLSRYLNGDNKPDYDACIKMAEKLGDAVTLKAGFSQPRQVTVSEFLSTMPSDLIPAFFASVREINSIASETGIDVDSPEGFEIVKAVFRKYGL